MPYVTKTAKNVCLCLDILLVLTSVHYVRKLEPEVWIYTGRQHYVYFFFSDKIQYDHVCPQRNYKTHLLHNSSLFIPLQINGINII